ncbi:MAG: DUF1588 domain-containing protein, partial [Verrucomicrobiales bacterium]|nr:DUF1588 domain-containing protein [Verrucomicrobiales bacterium]
PVVRGIWLLENLLDSPPPPPPANVEPLEPDVRGAKTIREMLAKHRENEGCAGCHSRIDPWGFALEHFDAIGAWRDLYQTRVPAEKTKTTEQIITKPIDARAELIDGHAFDGANGLRDTLLARSDRFTFALSAKLLAHALGHPTTLREKLIIEDIVKTHRSSGGGFADLITALCTSAPFLGR